MRKVFLFFVCLFAMLAASPSAKAQEITITLIPGCNWISYPNAEAMDVATALGDFAPVQGDIIKSRHGSTMYINGQWRGSLRQFQPGVGYKYYSMRTVETSFVFVQPSASTVATTTPTNVTVTSAMAGGMVTLPEDSHVFMRGVCWDIAPNPDIDHSHTSEGTGVGEFSSLLDDLFPHTTYYVRAYALTDYGLTYGEELTFTTLSEGGDGDGHECVDLGLPSGLLWATCNIGADAPEDYGDYFAWGETQPKSAYSWNTYQLCNGGFHMLTKYCSNSLFGYNGFTDNETVLSPEDDAATANWGSDWHMPTKEDWQELYNNTTCIWVTQNGVKGRLFIASNGNSLFLPASGYYNGTHLYYPGGNGYYWMSTLNTATPDRAWSFNMQVSGCFMVNYRSRHYGQSVRAVRSTPQGNTHTGFIDGKFTVNSEGSQVYFSQGNLQYIGSASIPYWKFAENQWECIGSTPEQNTNEQNVDRDLFGWGTSGWNNGNVNYQPWSTYSLTGSMYGPPGRHDLTGNYANADWGVYNSIINGGYQPNCWRTLTTAEWKYVFDTRTTPSGIRYAMAKVNNVNGVILLPDSWNASYHALSNTNNNSASFTSNTISASDWSAMEQHGAVFLPAAGYRRGTAVYMVGIIGNYWSSSYYDGYDAYYLYFYNSSLSSQEDASRAYGLSVRLVCPAN